MCSSEQEVETTSSRAAVAQAAEQVEAVLELVDPNVAAVDDPGEQPLVLEPALVGDQLDVLGPSRSIAGEVGPPRWRSSPMPSIGRSRSTP